MKRIFTLIPVLLLAACASMVDHQTQEITMRTPGAEDAKCSIQNQDLKYVAWTDQTIEIMKSPNDLVVHCLAAGNREQTVHVKRDINGWTFLNVVNGFVPGAAYDYFSRGAFEYPDELVVSFVGDPIKPYPLPEYHNDDLRHNNTYGRVEYMGPTKILTQEDRYNQPHILQKKVHAQNTSSAGFGGAPVSGSAPSSSGGYALDSIHRQYNPQVPYDPSEEDK